MDVRLKHLLDARRSHARAPPEHNSAPCPRALPSQADSFEDSDDLGANPSIDDIEQYMNVLGALEGLAGSKAAVNASDSELTNIKLLCEFMLQKRGQMQPLLAFNKDMEFHLSIVRAARNAPLIETHRQYNSRLWRARYISSQRQTGYQVTEQEHIAIVEALLRRDATATATAMVKHLQTGVQNIRQIMQEQNSSATP